MKNFDYEKKYHYLVKYFVIAFPLVIVLVLTLLDSITYIEYTKFVTDLGYFLDVEINSWYFNLLDLLNLRGLFDKGGVYSLLLAYPLYVFWVYVLDLILDVFVFVPKLAHKLMNKLGGY